jgi:kynureninase
MINEARVIPDFREPDNIRFGFAPLYTSFSDIDDAVERIRDLVIAGTHRRYETTRTIVT